MRRNSLWLALNKSILNSSNFFFEMILIFRERIICILRWRSVLYVRSITLSNNRNWWQNCQLNSFDITDKAEKIPSDEFRTTGDPKKIKKKSYIRDSIISDYTLRVEHKFVFHLSKDPSYEVCKLFHTCRARHVESDLRPDCLSEVHDSDDFITTNHKVVIFENETRLRPDNAIVVQDYFSEWFDPTKVKDTTLHVFRRKKLLIICIDIMFFFHDVQILDGRITSMYRIAQCSIILLKMLFVEFMKIQFLRCNKVIYLIIGGTTQWNVIITLFLITCAKSK